MYKVAIFSNLKLIPGKILKKMAFFTESEDPRPLKSEIKMFYSCGLLSIAWLQLKWENPSPDKSSTSVKGPIFQVSEERC